MMRSVDHLNSLVILLIPVLVIPPYCDFRRLGLHGYLVHGVEAR